MANITTTTSGLTSDRYSEFFNKKLLHHAIQQERLNQFCTKFDLPANVGSTTMRMFKRSEAAASTVGIATEGVASGTFTNSTLTPIDIPLVQYFEQVKISDTRRKTDLINQLKLEVERMGEASMYKVDEVIRDEVVLVNMFNGTTAITDSGFNLFVSGNKIALGSTEAQLETEWDSWKGGTAANLKLKVVDLRSAVTQLRAQRAMPIEGGYFCAAAAPQVIHDLQDDAQWNAVNQYNNGGEAIFKGEVGKIGGCKVLDWTLAFRQDSTAAGFGTFAATGDVFTTFVFGREAVGCMKLAGSTSPLMPRFIVNDKPDKSDPLNQFITAGWIGYFAAKVLDKSWMTAIHSKSTFC